MDKHINGVRAKQADTREEKLLLGYIESECNRIGFGTITLEVTIRNGQMQTIKSKEVERTFRVDSQ